jgi:hypothetical protein
MSFSLDDTSESWGELKNMDSFELAKSFLIKNFEKLNDGCDFFGYSLDEESMSSQLGQVSGSLKRVQKKNSSPPPHSVDLIMELDLEFHVVGKLSDLIADGFLSEEDVTEDDKMSDDVELDCEETTQVGLRVHFNPKNSEPSKIEFGYFLNERSSSGDEEWEFFESSDLSDFANW